VCVGGWGGRGRRGFSIEGRRTVKVYIASSAPRPKFVNSKHMKGKAHTCSVPRDSELAGGGGGGGEKFNGSTHLLGATRQRAGMCPFGSCLLRRHRKHPRGGTAGCPRRFLILDQGGETETICI
jgi:hypothetical protein